MKYEYQPANSFFKIGHLYKTKQHKVQAQNSPFGVGPVLDYTYYEIKRDYTYSIEYDPQGWEDDIMSFYFVEDESQETFSRNVLTFIEILEGLGGFLEIIAIFSAFLIAPVNSFFYQSFLIRHLYLYENKIDEKPEHNQSFITL